MISKIAIPVITVLAALYVIVSILTSGSNALSESMLYLAAFGIIVGLINAKAGMIFLFLAGNYLDLLKRSLVVGGTFSWADIIRTLAVAPVVTVAIFLGLLVALLKDPNAKWPWSRFILSGIIFTIVTIVSFLSGDTLQNIAQSIANSALYVGFIGFAALIYKSNGEQHRLFRFLLVIYIPVAIYGWIQLLYGYNTVEIEYARSGFTVSTQPLLHPTEVEYKRIFSTMSSAGGYTLVGSILSIYALIFGFGKGFLRRIAGIAFATLVLSSHIPGAGRTGWAIVIISFSAYFIFKTGKLTIVAYIISISASALLLFNADTVGRWLVENSQGLTGDSDFSQRAANMGTFTARTMGITEWMTNKDYFSWFGLSKAEIKQSAAHDLVGQIYVSSGVIGLFLALCLGIWILFYLHRSLLKIRDVNSKKLALFYIANIFAILFAGIVSGSSLHIFPLNVYFWLMAGLLFQLIDSNKKHLAGGRLVPSADEPRAQPLRNQPA